MFKHIREQLQGEKEMGMIATATLEGLNDNIKDRFLTDPELITLGAVDDPRIEKLVQSLPEYLPNPEATVQKLTESLVADLSEE